MSFRDPLVAIQNCHLFESEHVTTDLHGKAQGQVHDHEMKIITEI